MLDRRKHFGKWILRSTLAFAGLAGAIWALAGIGENDADKDGWSDEEEILAGTNPFDETEPWDSDGDGIADYFEFQNGTDPLDAGDPPKSALAGSAVGVASLSANRSGTAITAAETTLSPQPEITPAAPFPANATQGETSATLRLEGGTATGPGFKGTYELSVPVGNYYKIALSADDIAVVECDGMEVRSEWIPAEKRIRPGEGVSAYRDIADLNATCAFTISYENKGGPYVLSATITSVRAEKAPTVDDADENPCGSCTENCDTAPEMKNGSVDFTQPFGRTPFAVGFASGKLVLKNQVADGSLFSPAGLRYNHYLTRRVLSHDASTQSATISADGLWENVYENGVPASGNAWKSSQVSVADDGSVTETLSDRTVITYDASGNLASVTSPEGVTLSASQLGVEVLRDTNGALRQIYSLADGLLDIVTLDATHYEIRWYKVGDFADKDAEGLYVPSASPVKVFECGGPAGTTGVFEITERRGTTFAFTNRWEFDSEANEWIFSRGDDYENTRTWTELEDGNFAVTETVSSGADSSTTEELISPTNGNRYVGKSVDGVAEYTATRVVSGNGVGKVSTETDRSGATRAYEYDAHGRVIKETLSSGFGGFPETTEYVYAEHVAGTSVDLRPRSIVHKIAGTLFKTETYVYNDDTTAGKTESRSVTANGTTLTSETHYYPANTGKVSAGRVKYEIQADGTATYYEYSDTSFEQAMSGGYTLTETEGVWDNGAFAPVPAKSTRVVRVFDKLGNEVRTENHVHTGAAFELVSWENKSYSPTHKVIATERSNGKTSSADYICTGPVWTIDENGVRTDNTFDSAKRLKTSTRHGARGDVVTSYTYDAEGRVIAETQTAGTLSKTTSRSYDAFGELASETDALGNTTRYERSADGLSETVTFPDGGTRTTVRNANGETLSVTGTAVVAQYYAYGFENGLKTTTVYTGAENSARWEKSYVDAHGRTVKTERPGFGLAAVLTTENTYAGTRLVATASTGTPSVSYAHDALGNVLAQVSSIDSEWRKTETETLYEKDAEGIIWQKTTNTVSCSDESIPAQTSVSNTQLSGLSLALESKQVSVDLRGNETVTTSAYDLATKTRTQTTVFPQMTDVQTSVSVDGAVVSQSAPGGVNTSAVYDAFNRRTASTDARGNVTSYAYDAGDRLVSQTQTLNSQELIVNTYEYDSMNRIRKTVFADGTFVASAYDLRGNKIAEYGNASYPVLFAFDALNQKTGMQTFRTLAGSPEALESLTGGDATTWTYDAATGLLLAKTDAAGKSVVYNYTSTGLLASRTWARGIVTHYAYDAWNQLSATTYSDGTPGISQSYDALGRVVSTTDAAGTRSTSYDAYGNVSSESLIGGGKTHLLTELYDAFGRSLGYTYAKDGSAQQTVGTGYDADSGWIALASFVHGGAAKAFTYNYLAGTKLLESLVCPSNLTIMHSYEAERDLLAGITIRRGASTDVVLRNYTYDTLGRPLTRSTSRKGTTQSDNFGYNARSELTSATLGNDEYAYAFDNIGNRATETVAMANSESRISNYVTNNLNQYTEISLGEAVSSPLQYDADGNMTSVQTSTGTWSITYNGENRPIRFENTETQTVIDCGYDSQGRRFEKKVTVAGTVTLHHRYIYRGYLQIAALDLTRSNHPALWLVTWDPSQPTATRPLAIQKDGTWFTYGYDLTKNICEVFGPAGYIRTTYSYAPFGSVSASENGVVQPFQWSSEHYDSELDLVYYNFRHYSPSLGRFLSRDPIEEQGGVNLYSAFLNGPSQYFDFGGLQSNFYRMIKLASKASLVEITKEVAFSCVKEALGDVYQEATLVSVLKSLCGEAGVNPKGKSQWAKLPISIDLESELKKSVYDATIGSISSSVVSVLGDSRKVKEIRALLEKLSTKHLGENFSTVNKKLLAGAISSEIANEIKEELQLETVTRIKITKLNRKSCMIRYKTEMDFKLSYAGDSFSFSSEGGEAVLKYLPTQLRTACGCCKK